MGKTFKTNVPFCYLKYTMALACFGILHYHSDNTADVFKQPLCWGVLSCVTHLNKCTPSQQWLLFQASSSTCETSIWMMIKRSVHMLVIMFFFGGGVLQLIVCYLDVVTPCCIMFHFDVSPWCQWSWMIFFCKARCEHCVHFWKV